MSTPERWLVEALGGNKSRSGVSVTIKTAVQVVAVFACVRAVSEQIATLSCPIYKLDKDGSRAKDTKHAIHTLLNVAPNNYMTPYEFKQIMVANLMLWGDCYAEIERDVKTKTPTALWVIPAEYVTKGRYKTLNKPFYDVNYDDKTYRIPYENMLHISGMGMEHLKSFAPIEMAREAIGLSMSAEDFASEYYKNGVHPSGVIEYPGKLKGEGLENYKTSVKEAYSGLGNKHRLMLLEEGMKFNKIISSPDEGQMLESRKFQVEEICRFFNVPPHKVMHLEKTNYNSIEEMNLSFVQDTIVPYTVNFQQRINLMLFFISERVEYYAEFNLASLLRGRIKDRFDAYAVGIANGFMKPIHAAKLENFETSDEIDKWFISQNLRGINEPTNKITGVNQ